jgi:ketosteroid isomerase-like protein
MTKTITFFLLIAFYSLVSSCQQQENQSAKAKEAITKAEKDFETMAAEKGIAEAFWFFADTSAVIKRGNDSLIRGKEAIRNFYAAAYFKTASVKWSPDFVEASEDGSMGYTFGQYVWQSKDSSGKINEAHGVFHTVWRKQEDGSWKYVWD